MTTICVTGMHRSGTSFVARVVNLLGVDLGPEDQLMEPRPDNPKGFWESGPISALDDDLLDHLGGTWDHPPVLEDGWENDSGLDPWRDRARGVLDAAFDSATTRGWKDPRMSILLPFWRTVTEISSTIVVVRRPRDVAASLAARDEMTVEHSAELWVRYTATALHSAPDALVLRYDDFFRDLTATVDRLVDLIGLDPPDDLVRGEIASVLDPDLRHHRRENGGDAADELMLADFVFDAATAGRGPIVADALHRLTEIRGAEVVRLIEHRDDLMSQRDAAMSILEDTRDELTRTSDRVAVQSDFLSRLEDNHRNLGRVLAERERELVELREQIAELERRPEPPRRRQRLPDWAHVARGGS